MNFCETLNFKLFIEHSLFNSLLWRGLWVTYLLIILILFLLDFRFGRNFYLKIVFFHGHEHIYARVYARRSVCDLTTVKHSPIYNTHSHAKKQISISASFTWNICSVCVCCSHRQSPLWVMKVKQFENFIYRTLITFLDGPSKCMELSSSRWCRLLLMACALCSWNQYTVEFKE